jgi:hypothetical protein
VESKFYLKHRHFLQYMVQKHIIVSMIAPVAIAGILIMAILANQAYASSKSVSSSSEKCKTTENGNSQGEENCKTAQGENTQGKVAQESSKTGQTQPVRPAITLTPIQAHITTNAHMTTTNEQLSKNGIASKLTLAPKPTGPAVAPRLIGAKTIAEVQQLKKEAKAEEEHKTKFGVPSPGELRRMLANQIQFDPKTEICQGPKNIAQAPEKVFCLGKVIPRTVEREQKAMHPSLTASLPNKESHGPALTHEGPRALAKIVQKVAG